VNKTRDYPLQIILPTRKRKKEKRKEEKKGYTLQTAIEVAAVKVFWQNTTRSETRCGDCGKNP
jgi:hypothetical protein